MDIDINKFREKLEEERKKLTRDLAGTSEQNPKNPSDWEAVYADRTDEKEFIMQPDKLDVADAIEEYQERFSTTDVLEKRLREVDDALSRVKDGSYGFCSVGEDKHQIEAERLEANPAATTCVAHMDK